MAVSSQGAVSGGNSGTGLNLSSIIQRDLDRQRFAASKQARRARRDAKSHKNGFGTFSGARVA